MNLAKQNSLRPRAGWHLLLAATAACLTSAALAQSAPKAATESAAAALTMPLRKSVVVPNIWVIRASSKFLPGPQPVPKPVLTSESLAQLRKIACVDDVTARRSDAFVTLRAVDGKVHEAAVWVVELAGVNARGWRLSASTAPVGAHHASPDLAKYLGLPTKAAAGQWIEPTTYTPAYSAQVVTALTPSEEKSGTSGTRGGQNPGMKLPYGGTFDADLSVLAMQPKALLLRFDALFRSGADKWAGEQLARQHADSPTVYIRTKPKLKGSERESCRAQLDAHMQTWAKGLPQTTWELVPLED